MKEISYMAGNRLVEVSLVNPSEVQGRHFTVRVSAGDEVLGERGTRNPADVPKLISRLLTIPACVEVRDSRH